MRRLSLFAQLFLAMSLTSVVATVASGFAARTALTSAFDAYLAMCGRGMGQGQGQGAVMHLGAAEQLFLDQLNTIFIVATLAAVVLAVVIAYLVARSLARPVDEIESAALALAAGETGVRVTPAGPQEFVSLGESFNHMADSVQRSDELRARMISDVAHELRNPLASLRIQLEGVVDGIIQPDQKTVASLLEDTVMLGALVDDLRALSRAEEGALSFEMVDLDLRDVVERELDRASALAAEGVVVEANLPSESIMVSGDAVRLQEILRNLLANAIRHTRHGSVRVVVSRDDGHVRVAVVDTGEGVSEKDLPLIFERFYRSDESRAADTGGSGIGLAIVKSLVESHGGSVFAEHTPGGGATVGFTLPLL